jgi:TolB-like protein
MYSIAVVPFANMSTNQEIGFLADGLSEDNGSADSPKRWFSRLVKVIRKNLR